MIETRPPDARIYELLAEAGFGADLFNPRQHRCCELVDRYALGHADAPRAPVIAEYRDVVVRKASHRGPLRFVAVVERRVLHCWRCAFEVHDGRGAILLTGRVTLAPPRHGEKR